MSLTPSLRALLLTEGRARRVVVVGFVPAGQEFRLCLEYAGFWRAESEAASVPAVKAGPLAAALVLARLEGEGPDDRSLRLELRRRKRSSVTPPKEIPLLHPWLGAEAVIQVALAASAAKEGPAPTTRLRAVDPCTGAALWLTLRRGR